MRTRLTIFTIAALISVGCQSAFADDFDSGMTRVGWHVHQPARFMVSGVLRKNGTTDVIKPIQAIVSAADSDSAMRQFSKTVQRQYPGYSLIATLASAVPAAGTCESAI